jgi:hypothetical protein
LSYLLDTIERGHFLPPRHVKRLHSILPLKPNGLRIKIIGKVEQQIVGVSKSQLSHQISQDFSRITAFLCLCRRQKVFYHSTSPAKATLANNAKDPGFVVSLEPRAADALWPLSLAAKPYPQDRWWLYSWSSAQPSI